MGDDAKQAEGKPEQASSQEAKGRSGEAPAAKRRRFRWSVLWAMLLLIGLCGWAGLRFALSPDNMQSFIRGALAPYVLGRMEMGRVHFDLFEGTVVDGAKIYDGVGPDAKLVAEARRVVIAHRVAPLLEGEFVVDSIEVLDPVVHIREEDRGWNVERVLNFQHEGEPDPFPALQNGIWAESLTLNVESPSVFEDGAARVFRNCTGAFRPVSTSLERWAFELDLRDPDLGQTKVLGALDAGARTVEGTVECRAARVTPEFFRTRVPYLGQTIAQDWQPTGILAMKAEFTYSPQLKDPWRYDVEIECRDASTIPRCWPLRVEHVQGRIIVHDDVIYLRNLAGYVRAGNHHARPQVNGLIEFDRDHGILQVKIENLSLNEDVLATVPNLGEAILQDFETLGLMDGSATIDMSGEGMQTFDFTAKAHLRHCEFAYRHFPAPVRDIQSRLEVTRQSLKTVDLTATFCGGRVDNGSLCVTLTPDPIAYEASFTLSGVDLKQLLTYVPKQIKTATGERMEGLVAGDIHLKGRGVELAELSAEGHLKLDKGYVWRVPIVSKVIDHLRLRESSDKAVQKGHLACNIHGGELAISDALVTSGRVELSGRGVVDLRDGGVTLTVIAGLDPAMIADIPILKKAAVAVIGGMSRVVRKVEVTGTVAEPQVSFIAFRPLSKPAEGISDLIFGFGGREHQSDEPQPPADNDRFRLFDLRRLFKNDEKPAKPQTEEPDARGGPRP